MIKLVKLPKYFNKQKLIAENIEYLKEQDISILPSQLLDLEFNIDGFEYYRVYKDATIIGFITGVKVSDTVWYGSRVYLQKEKRIYLLKVYDALYNKLIALGFKDIITMPNKHTAKLYKKHNIGIRI